MRFDIITPLESDTYLAEYSDWLGLTDAVKESHIGRASVYVQTGWTCADIDWDDDETIEEPVKMAVAFYAYASLHNNLFGDITEGGTTGRIRSEYEKVGSLSSGREYFMGMPLRETALGYPDSLMSPYCIKNSASITLTRC